MTDQVDSDKRATDHEAQSAVKSECNDEAGKAASAHGLGFGLVLVGTAAATIAMFLPFAQPVSGLPILGKNTIFQLIGWHLLWPVFLIGYFGYLAGQGKRFARWSLIGLCALAAVAVVAVATFKDLRTMHLIGPGVPAAGSGPGILASLDVAVYVAAAGVAVATVGALALFQNARTRWQSTWPLAAGVVVVAVAVASYFVLGRQSTTPESSAASQTPTSLTPAQTALTGLLLSADQISIAMGTAALTVKGTTGEMPNLAAEVPDKACRPIVSPAEAEVYEGSGWNTMLGQAVAEPGPRFRHRVEQTVVSFASAKEASAFYAASARSWPACANRHFTVVTMGTNMAHTAGPVSNNNGTLSVTQNQDGVELVYACQRALTVANNVVVDVAACSLDRADAQFAAEFDNQSNAAINIAHQIAARVPAG